MKNNRDSILNGSILKKYNFLLLILGLISGLKELYIWVIIFSNPFITESTITNDIVPIIKPVTDITDRILIKLCDFFPNKYRFAM